VILKTLELQNFRNHQKLNVNFDGKVTLIIGHNGSGKTNILEAICILATGKSFKTGKDSELLTFGKNSASLVATTDTQQLELNFANPSTIVASAKIGSEAKPSVHPSSPSPSKLFKINNVPKSQSHFAGNLKIVLFRPEDLDLLTDGPSLRRDFLNEILCQLSKEYASALRDYTRGLLQRNRLLKDTCSERDLTFWDEVLIKNGELIQEQRRALLERFNQELPHVLASLFPNSSTPTPPNPITLNYSPNTISATRLGSHRQAERAAGITLIGPHRDDFEALEDGHNLTKFGSRGEQRTAVLALKLVELDLLTVKDERPLLLLDDIFSELDEAHQEAISNIVTQQQTILTATENISFTSPISLITLV